MTDASYMTEIEGLRAALDRRAIVFDSPVKAGREYALAEAAYAKVFDSICAAIFMAKS